MVLYGYVVLSGFMWGSGKNWRKVGKSGKMWLKVAKGGEEWGKRRKVAKSGDK